MEVELTSLSLNVRLGWWEHGLGLMGDISLARSSLVKVDVVADGIAAVPLWTAKVGVRIPGVIYVAQTLDRQRVFIVRRGEPALILERAIDCRPRLLVLGTPDAERLSSELRRGAGPSGSRP